MKRKKRKSRVCPIQRTPQAAVSNLQRCQILTGEQWHPSNPPVEARRKNPESTQSGDYYDASFVLMILLFKYYEFSYML